MKNNIFYPININKITKQSGINIILHSLIKLRNFFIKNLFVNIIGFKKKENNNYIWINDYYNHIILLIIPFIVIKIIANYIGYHVIYKYDNIYQITNIQNNHILPIILQLEAFSSYNSLESYDLTDKIKYYNSSLPLYIFTKLNIPQNYDNIKIKYLSKGKLCNKNIKIIEYENDLIYSLF